MANKISRSKRNPDIESNIRRLVATAHSKLDMYINEQFRRNLKGVKNTEQKVLMEVFEFLEKKYWEQRYGFYYDEAFKRRFVPYSVSEVVVKRQPDTLTGEKEEITYPKVEEMVCQSSALCYLHFPYWTKKEALLCFDSPKLVFAYGLARDYTCQFKRKYVTDEGTVEVGQMSTMLEQKYIDAERKRERIQTNVDGDRTTRRTYRKATIDIAPNLFFDQKGETLRMKRLDPYFFSPSCLEHLDIVPSGNAFEGYDPLTLFPYFLFLLVTNLRHNQESAHTLVKKMRPTKDGKEENFQTATKLFKTSDFDSDDLDFFCFVLFEINNMIETERWIHNHETLDDAKKKYDCCICDFIWSKWQETSSSESKDVLDVLSRIDPCANINALLYETRANKEMTELLKRKFRIMDDVEKDTPTPYMTKLDYFSTNVDLYQFLKIELNYFIP